MQVDTWGDINSTYQARGSGMRNPADEALHIEIFPHIKKNEARTLEQGHVSVDEKIYIKIVHPGGKDITEREITDEDKRKYPGPWQRWLNTQAPVIGNGVPLQEWPLLTRSEVEEYKSYGLHTVEQIASGEEQVIDLLGPQGRTIVKKAKAWLGASQDATAAVQQEKRIEDLMNQVETLTKLVSTLQANNESEGPKDDTEKRSHGSGDQRRKGKSSRI